MISKGIKCLKGIKFSFLTSSSETEKTGRRISISYQCSSISAYNFDVPLHIIHKNIDKLLISEIKINTFSSMVEIPLESHPIPYMLARNANSGTILLYVREDIPSTLLIFDLSIERFFVEINLMKTKFFPALIILRNA